MNQTSNYSVSKYENIVIVTYSNWNELEDRRFKSSDAKLRQ